MRTQRLFLLSILLFSLPTLNRAMDNAQEAFFKAAQDGETETIEHLLDSGMDVNIQQEVTGYTALYLAVAYNHPKTVEFLLEKKANPNIADVDSNTPLHIAVERNFYGNPVTLEVKQSTDIVAMLLEHKADLSLKNKNGKTPLELAKEQVILAEKNVKEKKEELNEYRKKYKKLSTEEKKIYAKNVTNALAIFRESETTLKYLKKSLDSLKNFEKKKPLPTKTDGSLINPLTTLTKQLSTLSTVFKK